MKIVLKPGCKDDFVPLLKKLGIEAVFENETYEGELLKKHMDSSGVSQIVKICYSLKRKNRPHVSKVEHYIEWI